MAYEPESTYLNTFDASQSPVWLEMLRSRYGGPAVQAAPKSPTTYLDLGCAGGHTILSLAPLYPHVQFVGVDFNANHIQQAEEEAQRLQLDNTRFVCADFRHLPDCVPLVDYMVVRGIYSWLTPDVKGALEQAMARLLKPHGLLKLHYGVRPGGLARETITTLLAQCEDPVVRQHSPAQRVAAARRFAKTLQTEAVALSRMFEKSADLWNNLQKHEDSLWLHDILNEDFVVENAHSVIERLQLHGLKRLASSSVQNNLPNLHMGATMAQRMAQLPPARGQTLLDHVGAAGTRDDVFHPQNTVQSAPVSPNLTYHGPWRYGIVVSLHKLLTPHQAPFGQLVFSQRPECVALLQRLQARPLSFEEMRSTFDGTPAEAEKALMFWLDMLQAAGRIAPFLSAQAALQSDRARLRKINRERLAYALKSLSAQTRTPLLAAEYGNCLVAGWFETLVLHHFDQRQELATQQQILARMRQAGMVFPGPDRQPAPDQLACFQQQLALLEQTHVPQMAYWGIEV